jgi:hypothetical protein
MKNSITPSRLLAALLLSALAGSAHALIKCTDEKGVTYYGDTLPPQCEKRALTEITTQGTVIRKIDAALTPEQIKAREADKLKNAEIEKKQAEQRLKDQALMSTYGSESEFNRARDRDLAQIDARAKSLQLRIAEVEKSLTKLGNEMEFYKAGKSKKSQSAEPPAQLSNDYNRAKFDRDGLGKELAKIEGDKLAVTARYDTEKERWKRLKAGMPPGTLSPEEKAAIEAAHAKSDPAKPDAPKPADPAKPAAAATPAPAPSAPKKP